MGGAWCSGAGMMLLNRWRQPYSFAWATQGPASWAEAGTSRRGRGPVKQAEPAAVLAELRANQETEAGGQSYYWASPERRWRAHTGYPSLASQYQVEGSTEAVRKAFC